MNKKVLLLILDGWGIAKNPDVSAIDKAHTPFIDSLYHRYPHSKLHASGLHVGLPEGQMGNSEVGHLNLGAGRIVYQDLVKISKAIEDRSLHQNQKLLSAFQYAKTQGKKVHFIGLVSDGGVHAHINHLKALCSIAHEQELKDVFIHAFTDGRDTDPHGALHYLQELEEHLGHSTGQIASIVGRYYAMDRDQRWERVKKAYDLLVKGMGTAAKDARTAVQASYNAGITDEFIEPIVIHSTAEKPLATIEAGDVVLYINFRADRARQLTEALSQKDFPNYGMKRLDLHYLAMTPYDISFKGLEVLFEKENLTQTLGEVVAGAGKRQIRIAETEKYPHVTYFFSGGREAPFEGEQRILCPSPKVATYDLQPEMSAADIRDKIIPEIEDSSSDFICLNFANPDMVGHTGVLEAAVKACETVDRCTKDIVETALKYQYTTIIIADHGNSDCMMNEDGSPNTAHTTSLVPCLLVDHTWNTPIKDGKLADIAPTIIELMGIKKPAEMTGQSLL